MKKIFTLFLMMGSVAMLMLAACKKDEPGKVTVSASSSNASVLTASTTTPALSKATLTNTAVTFTATAPNYGYNAAATNTLQFAIKGTNFAAPTEVALTAGALSKAYTVQDFNNLLLGMNLPTTSASQLEVRVKSILSATTTAGTLYSNVLTVTATPFPLISYVYVPGAYQGWNPATADSLQSATGNGVYTGIINFTAGNNQFLITPAKNWNNKYATGDAAKTGTSVSYSVTYNGANNFYAPTTAGLYQVTLDVNANTLTIAPVAYYYSIIGDAAIDWSTDVDMKFNNGTQQWTLTTALKSTGAFKFRRNHDWGTSYGLPSPVNGGTLTSSNGGNITVSATGTYAITFAVSATDATSATYTATKQ